ncbi:glycosyl hydrolase family 8 [Catenulispora yoronensis]|uniref:Glycosyl hydrolase family 8 n=1 Tax=Catenulispora yoronensis TaxID=450799 RepID=A0ABP5FHA3_9ACTN
MSPRTRRTLSLGATISTLTLGLMTATASQSAHAAGPAHAFPSHQTYKVGVMPSASQAVRDAAVQKQYDSWKATYLVHGCATNEYYVSTKGDKDATNNGPVSEGQGYGMNIVPLMAGYDANAQAEFNGLWQLVKDHEDQYGMMQWQLDGKTCKYYSSGAPDGATDGDLDIGYGLILADKQWGGYQADALNWLSNFYAHNVAPDGHLKCEDDGPNTDTRPSDQMIDHLRAFAAYDSAHDWNKVITRTEAVDSSLVSNYSSAYGLLPDFVVGANATPQPAPAHYQENQPDNIVGYNSIRVPWHMGTDALLNGTAASFELSDATKWSNCAKQVSGANPGKVYPHLNLNCTGYNTTDLAEEAGDAIGPSAMAAGDQAWTDTIWSYLQTNPYGDGYFGESIKTLVMIVMAGDYWSPAASSTPPPANNFSVSDAPASGTVTAGSSVSSTVSTAVVSGSAESVSLTASGLPSGATASFSPAGVTAGGGSTLTIATSASTASGTYPVTITATAPSATHTATFSLAVTGPGGGGGAIVNGGFESGSLTGWTVNSGSASAVSSPVHAGGFAALVGAGAETNGLSKLSQKFTAPSGSSTLSLWYNVSCTDSSGGYATVLLVDNTSSSTTRVLNRVCTTGQGWKSASAALTAGHSYTVELESRDDGVSGTPTNAVYDDVTVS